MERHFDGKVALVTGGGSGIGRTISLAFARAGAQVVIGDIDSEGGQETAHLVSEAGAAAEFIRADVSKPGDVEALIKSTVKRFSQLNCAINNAGVEGDLVEAHEYPDESWDRLIAINLTGVFLCLKHEVRQMLGQGGGSIVNMASTAGLGGAPRYPAYSASKHGVIGLTKSAAMAYGKSNIRVNAVCPGFTETPMLSRVSEILVNSVSRVPVGRYGQAEEIAAAALWLCSDAASYVTGVALPVDGGMKA